MVLLSSMTRQGKLWLAGVLGCLLGTYQAEAQIKVLVYHGSFGYAHTARVTGTKVIKEQLPTLLGATPAFTVDNDSLPSVLTTTNLAKYQVLVLNNNTGIGGLTTAQRSSLYNFCQTKGVVALHSTADFKGGASWPEMVSYVGGSLDGHTAAMGKLRKETAQANHPINEGLANEAWMNDEWYGYSTNPRNDPNTTVLWNIDESSMTWTSGSMGDHPIAWIKEFPTGGRLFYTAQCHRDSILQKNAQARRIVYNAILWAANSTPTRISTAPKHSSNGSIKAMAEKTSLRISFAQPGRHSFKVVSTDGRILENQAGNGTRDYSIEGLTPGSVYWVNGKTEKETFAQKVIIP